MRLFVLLVCLTVSGSSVCRAENLIRSAAELQRLLSSGSQTNRAFAIERATIVASRTYGSSQTIIVDKTGSALVFDDVTPARGPYLQQGDIVRLSGETQKSELGFMCAIARKISVIGHEPPQSHPSVTAQQILNGELDLKFVTFNAIVRDVFRDEIDRMWTYIALQCGSDILYATLATRTNSTVLARLIGSEVSVSGCPLSRSLGARLLLQGLIHLGSESDIRPTARTSADPFRVPTLEDDYAGTPFRLDERLSRRRISGRVIAVCPKNTVLLRTAIGRIVKVQIATQNAPSYGTNVEVSGFPETDLFRRNLSCATWRPTHEAIPAEPPPVPVSSRELYVNVAGAPGIDITRYGSTLRISGRILDLPTQTGSRFNLDCAGITIPVDIGACPEARDALRVGCVIEAAGIGLMEIPNWHPNAPFPHVNEFVLAVRAPADIRVLAYPSWWTPQKFLLVIGLLLLVVLAVLIWNTSLRRIAARKGRELMEEQLGHVTAELKTEERTRLAVELHDSLAQNLTGVSLEIDTAAKVLDESPASTKTHLTVAARSLKSCRDELRNCLWDLRNRALEERTMDEAIRQTLAPHVAGVDLAIRFNVPRERISDNTAHAILRIIRELTLNGIRHGGATKIRIAGSVEGDRMLFSVRDNGCGFDPDAAPGFDKGHYGLLGIRERVDEFEGEFAIASKPGPGTKATISLTVPQENRQT